MTLEWCCVHSENTHWATSKKNKSERRIFSTYWISWTFHWPSANPPTLNNLLVICCNVTGRFTFYKRVDWSNLLLWGCVPHYILINAETTNANISKWQPCKFLTRSVDKHLPRIACHACRSLFVHCEIKWWKKKIKRAKLICCISLTQYEICTKTPAERDEVFWKWNSLEIRSFFLRMQDENRREFQPTPEIGLLRIKNWLFHREFTWYDPSCPTFTRLLDQTHTQRMTSEKIRRERNFDQQDHEQSAARKHRQQVTTCLMFVYIRDTNTKCIISILDMCVCVCVWRRKTKQVARCHCIKYASYIPKQKLRKVWEEKPVQNHTRNAQVGNNCINYHLCQWWKCLAPVRVHKQKQHKSTQPDANTSEWKNEKQAENLGKANGESRAAANQLKATSERIGNLRHKKN